MSTAIESTFDEKNYRDEEVCEQIADKHVSAPHKRREHERREHYGHIEQLESPDEQTYEHGQNDRDVYREQLPREHNEVAARVYHVGEKRYIHQQRHRRARRERPEKRGRERFASERAVSHILDERARRDDQVRESKYKSRSDVLFLSYFLH